MRHLVPLALSLLLPLLVPNSASAERYHLEGEVVHAEPIGEVDGVLILFRANKKTLRIEKSKVSKVEAGHPLADSLQKRYAKARLKHLKKRWKLVDKVLRRFGRAPAATQKAIAEELATFQPASLVHPLGKALKSSKAHLRLLALDRLEKLKGVNAERPLVQTAILAKEAGLRKRAHAAALRLDKTRTRTYYEQIAAMPTAPQRRVRAIRYLAGMGDVGASPGLIFVLEKVELELKATLVTAGGLRRIPVNLGTRGGAAINAPIELPETSVISVKTKITATSLRQIQGLAGKALKTLSGQDHGTDTKAWRRWWKQRPQAEPSR
jgi:hypothetical protein